MKIQTSRESHCRLGWSAIDANTYDADCDDNGFFSTSPVGHGATEREAIADLLSQLEDEGRPPLRADQQSYQTAEIFHPKFQIVEARK